MGKSGKRNRRWIGSGKGCSDQEEGKGVKRGGDCLNRIKLNKHEDNIMLLKYREPDWISGVETWPLRRLNLSSTVDRPKFH